MSRFKVKNIRVLDTIDRIDLLGDVELLTALCSTQNDASIYSEFVRRFLPEVQAECSNICKRRNLDSHIGKQIAHEVFEKVRKYKSFKPDKIRNSTPHNSILIYLFSISRNLFNDWHNSERKSTVDYNKNYFELLTETIEIPDTPDILKWKKDTAAMIFRKLNKKEQTIVLADIEYKKYGSYLPDEITESLALSLKVKKPTIRKIRERAILKIKTAIDEINQK